jgi:hypothetical protein
MAGKSVLDKAESFARRVLQRLGAKVDSKLGSEDRQTLSPSEVGALTARLEAVIEANLREDKNKIKRVAPNLFKVLFTYEETSRLNTQYIEALGNELRALVYEYVNNRRYEILGGVKVETGSDLFAKSTVIKARFEGDEDLPEAAAAASAPNTQGEAGPARSSTQNRLIILSRQGGQDYRLDLKKEGAPACLGRVAGNAVRIDDASISRLHCSFALRSNGEIVVSDLGSSNGTYVNGEILNSNEARALKQGDTVKAGDVSLTVSEII